MKLFLIAVSAIIVLLGFGLAVFPEPAGWIIVAAGLIAVFDALMKGDLKARHAFARRSHAHGPEDRRRGPNDDPMLR